MKLFSLLLLLPSLALADVTVNGTVQIFDAGVRLVDRFGNEATYVEDGHIQAALDTTLVSDRAIGTTLNTNVWTGATTTMTMDTLSGFYRLNASAITTAASTASISTIKLHSVGYADLPIFGEAVAKVANLPLANSTAQLGFFSFTGTTPAATDGCYFEWNASAEFRAVTNFNGTPLQSGVLPNPSANIVHVFTVQASYDECVFWVDGTQVALIPLSNVGGTPPLLGPKLTYNARVTTSAGAPLLAPSLQVAAVTTYLTASNVNKTFAHQLAGGGRAAYQSPITTYTQTANHANSTSPTSATLSNTAAGYTTLGGRYQFAAPVGAATDFALFGFQVPAGLQLYVTGIRISACNTVAAVATTATVLDWAIGANSSAVSLATADVLGPPPTAWGPRRIPLDTQGFIVGAAAGACAPTIVHTFSTPVVVDSARFFHVILQVPIGTATATEVIRGDVLVEGYFE
jgi:hypothetical protein